MCLGAAAEPVTAGDGLAKASSGLTARQAAPTPKSCAKRRRSMGEKGWATGVPPEFLSRALSWIDCGKPTFSCEVSRDDSPCALRYAAFSNAKTALVQTFPGNVRARPHAFGLGDRGAVSRSHASARAFRVRRAGT